MRRAPSQHLHNLHNDPLTPPADAPAGGHDQPQAGKQDCEHIRLVQWIERLVRPVASARERQHRRRLTCCVPILLLLLEAWLGDGVCIEVQC